MDQRYSFAHVSHCRVLLERGAERSLPRGVSELAPHGVYVIHDPAVEVTARRIGEALRADAVLQVPAGAAAKRLEVAGELAAALHAAGATRASVIVAVGGGVVTDLVGFVASIYLRGVALVSCPTTTLAMCDAALGGKNGVDHCGLKNRLGTIRQPDAVLMDIDWLKTLPEELYREGLVEVVKKAAVLDAARFAELEQLAPALRGRRDEAVTRAVEMAVQMKMSVVLADEREGDRRRALNAGHTIGHALESLAGGALRHGEAVAIGLVAECRAAGVASEVTARVAGLLRGLGVDAEVPTALRDAERLWDLARHDKKAARGSVPMCVPATLGAFELVPLSRAALEQALT